MVLSLLADLQPIVFPVMAVYSGEADRTLSAALAPRAPALLRVGGVRVGEVRVGGVRVGGDRVGGVRVQ